MPPAFNRRRALASFGSLSLDEHLLLDLAREAEGYRGSISLDVSAAGAV